MRRKERKRRRRNRSRRRRGVYPVKTHRFVPSPDIQDEAGRPIYRRRYREDGQHGGHLAATLRIWRRWRWDMDATLICCADGTALYVFLVGALGRWRVATTQHACLGRERDRESVSAQRAEWRKAVCQYRVGLQQEAKILANLTGPMFWRLGSLIVFDCERHFQCWGSAAAAAIDDGAIIQAGRHGMGGRKDKPPALR